MDHNIVLPAHTRIVSEENNKGTYEIDGLYPGYGHTLGNALRRIMLSSLPGAAVTKIKIEGASHEFATLPGVLEDVVMILLNIKQLRFKLHGSGPETATVEVKGIREVKGKDIKCPTQLEVMSKDLHIATLTEKNAQFSAEFTVEKGIGFVPSEELVKDKVAVGVIILDAIFTPIRRATYEVENMRVGDRTDYNRLRLFIETDGTISTRDALKEAVSIMRKQIAEMDIFENKNGQMKTPAKKEVGDGVFSEMKLSARTKNALMASGLKSPLEIAEKSEAELKDFDGVGDKAVSEIKKALAKLGLLLKE
ncbi:DNA-directed RNA polymerase subunit alpha [Candidatus Giovannonibacteria bacterium RIFCSPLOWO2_01_FULL_43_160]|uniref:DNA-directed RNA polymerase subunit alpha n=2 Tax=Candidatus Giovannoniibacteriota TaxID=1752738 RepID=A0A0G1L469_9BACT|nr:MAG: DNA-directed RNA polymerase subunit alpha [Candidatus Giovannonibacteria bacterium GW2011_GWB1_43_13]KKS99456.1 MAG: DNA-directed RNA polymerase subunit alpha [Candidatus Giovannonibacteria bacterium GW2011_GWA1_43_15]KKT20875.1 MAG: DNA-directed RNA polymerase subunit alpha [Candidatus Giovannonibacteria bacterium GW2011_GWC2_43_8]KKT63377.1 MAG: DNA-directed RNA polymerase subunit alpha [Candidatus Giovannonibacteria bacterium GW2011_GWA2_44_26]OGF58965.1 MAG: DNA-directed RNA polymer